MNRFRDRSTLAALFACGLATLAAAGADLDPTSPLRISRTAWPIRVDANLDETAWQSATLIPLAFEIMPGENIPPPVETSCWVTYDQENLYVAFRANDPEPERICARLTDRDDNFGDDQVGLFIDTFDDGRRAFEFFVNPLGVQTDVFRNDLAEDESEDGSWDAIWNSAGRLTADGYVVEMAIPFSALRFPRTSEEQRWGVLAFRNYPRSQRHQLCSIPYDRSRGCDVCQYGKLTGFTGIRPGRSLEFDPTLTGRRHDVFIPGSPSGDEPGSPARWDEGSIRSDVGLSARWAMTPNLMLNVAANPDFSQVEADAAQLSVNTRYALFYDERRPFFLEGADFFATPLAAVHTRTIADPDWGGKLTGKEAGNAVGVFVTRDARNNVYFPSNAGTGFGTLAGNVTTGVLRYRHDVGAEGAAGILTTLRESGDYHNRVYGGDGRIRFAGSETLTLQALGSSTRYLDAIAAPGSRAAGDLNGFAGSAAYAHNTRDWNWSASYEDLGEDFRADAGFIPRVDTREVGADVSYTRWGRTGAAISQTVFGAEFERVEDHHGTRTDQFTALRVEVTGPRQLYLRPRLERRLERFAGTTHTLDWALLRFGARPCGPFNFWGVVAGGDGIDYENDRKVTRLWGGPGFSYDFGRRVRFFIDHTYEILGRGDDQIYSANLLQGRVVYQFSARSFVRVVGQFTAVDFNPRMYPPAGSGRPAKPYGETELFLQLLGSYKVNPQTVVYLGYADQRFGVHARNIRSVDRTFFLKLGYAWMV